VFDVHAELKSKLSQANLSWLIACHICTLILYYPTASIKLYSFIIDCCYHYHPHVATAFLEVSYYFTAQQMSITPQKTVSCSLLNALTHLYGLNWSILFHNKYWKGKKTFCLHGNSNFHDHKKQVIKFTSKMDLQYL